MTANQITETLKNLMANRSKMNDVDRAKANDIIEEFGSTCLHCCNDEQIKEIGDRLKDRTKDLAWAS